MNFRISSLQKDKWYIGTANVACTFGYARKKKQTFHVQNDKFTNAMNEQRIKMCARVHVDGSGSNQQHQTQRKIILKHAHNTRPPLRMHTLETRTNRKKIGMKYKMTHQESGKKDRHWHDC